MAESNKASACSAYRLIHLVSPFLYHKISPSALIFNSVTWEQRIAFPGKPIQVQLVYDRAVVNDFVPHGTYTPQG